MAVPGEHQFWGMKKRAIVPVQIGEGGNESDFRGSVSCMGFAVFDPSVVVFFRFPLFYLGAFVARGVCIGFVCKKKEGVERSARSRKREGKEGKIEGEVGGCRRRSLFSMKGDVYDSYPLFT